MAEITIQPLKMNLLILILLNRLGEMRPHEIKKALSSVLERKVSKGSIVGTMNRLFDQGLIEKEVSIEPGKRGPKTVVKVKLTPAGEGTVKRSLEYHAAAQRNLEKVTGNRSGSLDPGIQLSVVTTTNST